MSDRRLSADDVRDIVVRRRAGTKVVDLAAEYKVTPAAISYRLAQHGETHRQAGCGTDAGYQRHRRIRQRPCEACTAAHAAHQREWLHKARG